MRDASGWDRNPPNFMCQISYSQTIVPLSASEGILRIYLFTYTLIGYWSAQFMRRALLIRTCGNRLLTRVLNPRDVGGAYIITLC